MSRALTYSTSKPCTQAVIFARVSSDKQEREGVSLDVQMDTITDYCKNKNLKIIKEFNISESSTKGERTQYFEMLDFVQSQKNKTAIVVNFVDRLQRNPDDTGLLNSLRREDKIEIHFIKENLILHKDSSGMDLIFWNMYVLMAYSPIVNMVDKVKSSLDLNWSKGLWQGLAPCGYLNTKNDNDDKWVDIDPVRGPMVKRLFEEAATGLHTMQSLENLAKEMGLTSYMKKKGQPRKIIGRSGIHALLKNPFYYGVMRVKGNYIPHAYEPLIDKPLFDVVQAILSNNAKVQFKLGYKGIPYTFRGLVKCGTCDGAMTSETHKTSSGNYHTYLKCNHRKGPCNQGSVREDILLDQLNEEVFSHIKVSETMLKNIKLCVRDALLKESKINKDTKKTLNTRITELKKKEAMLFDWCYSNNIAKEIYDDKLAVLKQEQEQLQQMADKYDEIGDDVAETIENILDIAANVPLVMKSSIIEEKRALLNLILSNATINGSSLCFSLKKPFDRLLISKGCTTWLGWLDSNQRMPIPKTGALPLGDTPIRSYYFTYYKYVFQQPQ